MCYDAYLNISEEEETILDIMDSLFAVESLSVDETVLITDSVIGV
jgi:nucleotidyltransferase/DNA polymerase involved in DNA repair